MSVKLLQTQTVVEEIEGSTFVYFFSVIFNSYRLIFTGSKVYQFFICMDSLFIHFERKVQFSFDLVTPDVVGVLLNHSFDLLQGLLQSVLIFQC